MKIRIFVSFLALVSFSSLLQAQSYQMREPVDKMVRSQSSALGWVNPTILIPSSVVGRESTAIIYAQGKGDDGVAYYGGYYGSSITAFDLLSNAGIELSSCDKKDQIVNYGIYYKQSSYYKAVRVQLTCGDSE